MKITKLSNTDIQLIVSELEPTTIDRITRYNTYSKVMITSSICISASNTGLTNKVEIPYELYKTHKKSAYFALIDPENEIRAITRAISLDDNNDSNSRIISGTVVFEENKDDHLFNDQLEHMDVILCYPEALYVMYEDKSVIYEKS